VHKTANVLNKLPKSIQTKAKEKLHQIWMAPDNKAEGMFQEMDMDYWMFRTRKTLAAL
jgi:hypothetical protein